MPRITVIGSFNMDLVVMADRLPGAGETVVGFDFFQGPGGKGSNQAIAARRLGAEVSFIGAVGTDQFGEDARQLHLDEGIDISGLAQRELPTGVALIVVDRHGENQIAAAAGANGTVDAQLVEMATETISSSDVLIGQMETSISGFLAAAEVAKAAGRIVILNPAPGGELPDRVWSLIDVVTPNEHELQRIAGDGRVESLAAKLHDLGKVDVVVTQGAQGVTWVGSEGSQRLPATSVDAVDTTGAGDAFNAGLAVGLSEGQPMEDAIRLALRAGAFAVTRLGVLDGLATRDELDGEIPL